MLFLALGLATATASAKGAAPRPDNVYLLRGIADVFSRGLDSMGATLVRRGIDARVVNHSSWARIAQQIIADRKRHRGRPVVLVGHSLGANAAIRIAERLQRANIPVGYIATLAATNPDPIPSNVRRVDNYYFKSGGWGVKIVGDPNFSGTLRNRDLSGTEGTGHFNLDDQPAIQREVLRNVARYARAGS
jgi:pimeloyl-ACP methyl ester carboxylesterase